MLDGSESTKKIQLYTIGYEGSDVSEFVLALRNSSVKTLIDVRELPLSRKKGFSKNGLRDELEHQGIKYMHVRQLGDPKSGRIAARAGDFAKFRKIFNKHMSLEASKAALASILPVVKSGGACLLCFERSHKNCHRSIVASELELLLDIEVINICAT